MRQYIDAVRRLTEEADIIPFPTAQRAEVVKQDRHRFSLLVVAAKSQGAGVIPKVQKIDRMSGLAAEEVAVQLLNYHPDRHNGEGLWASKPMGNTTFYMRVMVGKDAPSEHDLAEIEQHLGQGARSA